MGEMGVGGVEILGYDAARANYASHFFDSQGHVTVADLIFDDAQVDLGRRADPHHLGIQRGRQDPALASRANREWRRVARLAMDVTSRRSSRGDEFPGR
jgi:hypothetical protein